MSTSQERSAQRLRGIQAGIRSLHVQTSVKNVTMQGGVSVAAEALEVHNLLTKHELLYTKDEQPGGAWMFSGMRAIRSKNGTADNPNLQLPDGVCVYYGSLSYSYNLTASRTVEHDVMSLSPIILDLKARAPSKSKNGGTYGVDWWNVYIPTDFLEKLTGDIQAATGMVLNQEGIIMDKHQGFASITVNTKKDGESPNITMVTVGEEEVESAVTVSVAVEDVSTDGDAGDATGENVDVPKDIQTRDVITRQDMGSMREIMRDGGEDQLLGGIAFFTFGVSCKAPSTPDGAPQAGNNVKLSLKMKGFHATNVIESGIRRITYTSSNAGFKF